MWKKRVLCLVLVVCAILLTACQQQETFPNQPRQNTAETAEQAAPVQQESAPQQLISSQTDFDSGAYDPTSEEGGDSEYIGDNGTPVPTVYSDFAGATPVKIDPIDKPTPTPLPKLTFSYTTYSVSAFHLTFDGPAGWIPDESIAGVYTLTNPDPSMDYAAKVEIRATPVNTNYNAKELTKEVKAALDSIRSEWKFKTFEGSDTASRFFIDGNGVYASFRGNLDNLEETGVAGRVIINCVNKTLYVMIVSYPRSMADTFAEGVYNKARHTMKLAQ